MIQDDGSLGERLQSLRLLFAAATELLGDEVGRVPGWEARLSGLQEGENEPIRVAVAGAVKSGKSTLVNLLIGRDALKRGAGIVTSLVTRVRPGPGLRARVRLKGWLEVNREVNDAAPFLFGEGGTRALDLRSPEDRESLVACISRLREEALGEGGFFQKHVALLRAYLEGYARIEPLLEDGARDFDFSDGEFERHRDFAGDDALAAYVDDMVLEIPGLPLGGLYELGDCQGYDSPNPRHKEKVQEYLLSAHLVIHVVSSRVGLREADIVFWRDLRAFGLLPLTRVALNVDLGEHRAAEELEAIRERLVSELRLIGDRPTVYAFSALRSLLENIRSSGRLLSRKEGLLMELWSESTILAQDEFRGFLADLEEEIGGGRRARLSAARETALIGAAEELRQRLGTALTLAGRESEKIEEAERALRAAKGQVRASLESFENALRTVADRIKREVFDEVDAVFHPAGGEIAESVIAHARTVTPSLEGVETSDPKALFRQLTAIYQEMRAAFHGYKVEVVNPRAVERIRALWATASGRLAEAARAPADLVIRSVEGYRRDAEALGIQLPAPALPALEPGIGRRTIALFSAVTFGSEKTAERLISFTGEWTRRFVANWAKRLVRGEKQGFARAALSDGVKAVQSLLAEDARANLLHYNDQIKYRILGPSLEELASAWSRAYRETVEALLLDLDRLADGLRREGSQRQDLIPRAQEVLHALDRLVAGETPEPGRTLESPVR